MGAILDSLQRLQKIERDLGAFHSKEESFRRQIRNTKRLIGQNQAEYDSHLEAITKFQMEIDSADLDIKAREQSLARHRQALNTAKTNKEYAAILTALNTEKADASKCESRILEAMSRKEELVAKSREFEEEQQRLNERLRKQEGKLAEYIEDTQEHRKKLEVERERAAEEVPPSALETFNRVAAKLEGEAMAPVERLSTRGEEHVCGGCNMSIPLEYVSKLRGMDELLLCNSCGRILYLK